MSCHGEDVWLPAGIARVMTTGFSFPPPCGSGPTDIAYRNLRNRASVPFPEGRVDVHVTTTGSWSGGDPAGTEAFRFSGLAALLLEHSLGDDQLAFAGPPEVIAVNVQPKQDGPLDC